ncbi:MCE family protein [Amycolatopsis sp.]|uniref:MCE family protein n=1 Tax=Amycolatopsis sp. TaxID=37632 RepID=UPI002C3880AB|nr:MCE family protein [Amycolatopsis sp.]HVV08203.1 MCE family protein [Amycolatopsis sp.]
MIRRLASYRFLAVLVVLALGAAGFFVVGRSGGQRHAAVYFQQANGLYAGDEVRILGVPVGKVTKVEPQADQVRVEISYDPAHPIPQQAHAAIVAPSLVTSRFVQLDPPYTGGEQLADGGTIPVSRTAIPVEWDQITAQLNKLTTDLGPQGANSDGALTRLLDTASANLDGQGANLRDTVTQLSKAVSTLADGSGDLFGVVRNLQTFVTALASSDDVVARFQNQLASVSGVLDDNRTTLATTLSTLDSSLGVIRDFVRNNRGKLGSTLDSLTRVAGNLAGQRQTLADILQVAPTAVANFNNVYDPLSGSLNGAVTDSMIAHPATFVCAALFSVGGPPESCQAALQPLLAVIPFDHLPVGVNPVVREGMPNQIVAGQENSTPPPAAAANPPADPALLGLLIPGGLK